MIREFLNTQRYHYYDLTANIYPRMFGIEPIKINVTVSPINIGM